MSADKYPSIFSRQMEAIVYIIVRRQKCPRSYRLLLICRKKLGVKILDAHFRHLISFRTHSDKNFGHFTETQLKY